MSDIQILNNNGILTVSSKLVARDFEKEHRDVTKAIGDKIENLTAENYAVKIEDYFIESEYVNDRGRTYKEYLLTRDGFTLLVMGFTGKKALAWQLKYVKAFNEMEEELKNPKGTKQITNEETKRKNAEARLMNAKTKALKIVLDNPTIPSTYKEIINSKLVELATGEQLIPLPKIGRKTYSATEIGKQLSISSNKVGIIANAHNLKTDEYGVEVFDKSKYSNKQVVSFRYYDNAIEEIRKYI